MDGVSLNFAVLDSILIGEVQGDLPQTLEARRHIFALIEITFVWFARTSPQPTMTSHDPYFFRLESRRSAGMCTGSRMRPVPSADVWCSAQTHGHHPRFRWVSNSDLSAKCIYIYFGCGEAWTYQPPVGPLAISKKFPGSLSLALAALSAKQKYWSRWTMVDDVYWTPSSNIRALSIVSRSLYLILSLFFCQVWRAIFRW